MQRKKQCDIAFIERGVEDVNPSHPDPKLHPTLTLEGSKHETGGQVAAIGGRGNKCRRWRKRGEWPESQRKAGAQEHSEAGEAGVVQRDIARMRAQVEVAERERRQERQEETDRLNRLEQKLTLTLTELQTEQTEREQTEKQLQTALNTNVQLQSQMTELREQITEITEITRAQIETDQSCTDGLKQKLTAEQDRATTAQIQIELSTEMNEQLQLQIADLTTTVEQLRNRPTEHDSKQTDIQSVTAVPKIAAPQKAAAVKRTRVLPRAAAGRQVAPQKAPAQKGTPGKSQGWLELQRVERFVEWRRQVRAGMEKFMGEMDAQVDEDHIIRSTLKGCFWDRFNDEDVVDDVSATVKWVQIYLRHPRIQDIVNSEDGRLALILLETVETLVKTAEGTGGC